MNNWDRWAKFSFHSPKFFFYSWELETLFFRGTAVFKVRKDQSKNRISVNTLKFLVNVSLLNLITTYLIRSVFFMVHKRNLKIYHNVFQMRISIYNKISPGILILLIFPHTIEYVESWYINVFVQKNISWDLFSFYSLLSIINV